MQSDEISTSVSRAKLALQVVVVAVLAAAMGVALAVYLPGLEKAWSGLALVIMWLLVELALGALVFLGGIPEKPEKPFVAAAVVAGFYAGALVTPVVAA